MAITFIKPALRWQSKVWNLAGKNHIDLEGTRGNRVLLYEEDAQQMAILRGKAELEVIEIYGYTLMITMFCNPFLWLFSYLLLGWNLWKVPNTCHWHINFRCGHQLEQLLVMIWACVWAWDTYLTKWLYVDHRLAWHRPQFFGVPIDEVRGIFKENDKRKDTNFDFHFTYHFYLRFATVKSDWYLKSSCAALEKLSAEGLTNSVYTEYLA